MSEEIKNPWIGTFSTRVSNDLFRAGITTVKELTKLSDAELLRMPNLGRRSLNEVREVLPKLDVCVSVVDFGELSAKITIEIRALELRLHALKTARGHMDHLEKKGN